MRRTIVARRDLHRLSGDVVERKVGGRILFAASAADFDAGQRQVVDLADELLSNWFVCPLPPLVSTIVKQAGDLDVTRDAVTVFLHDAIRRAEFLVLGMLTQDELEPYLALARKEDDDEVARQLEEVDRILAENGHVRRADLPTPRRRRSLLAWRDSILRHAEFLGWGSYADGALTSWR